MLSIRPITARLAARLRGMRPPDWSGFHRELVHPASVVEHERSVALPDEYDRIKGTLAALSLEDEVRTARGGPREHPATHAYRLGRALIADGSVYYPGGHLVMGPGLGRPLARGTPARLGEALLCNSSLTEGFFGHWLLDTPALMVLAEQRGVRAVSALTPARSAHRLDYTAALGIPIADERLAIVEELWFIDDLSTNAGRGERLREVRRRIRGGRRGHLRRVILDRKLGGVRRNLENAPALWDRLVRDFGFEVVDPLALSQAELVDALWAAELVVGVEGSALSHAVLAAPEGALIFAIMPPGRFCTANKWYTDLVGLKFGFAVAEGTDSDFRVEPDRLARAIALAVEEVGRRPVRPTG